ncbi:MAG: hypothetical protein R3A79_21060 [Nannocystaceae bacterium]
MSCHRVSVGFFALLLLACGDDGTGSASETATADAGTATTGGPTTTAATDASESDTATATATATTAGASATTTDTSVTSVTSDSDTDAGTDSDTGEISGCVVLVDGATGDDAAPGGSWFFAKRTVGAGLDAAEALALEGRGPCEVWVAAGTYTPSDALDLDATFALRPDIALYGGFAGGEKTRDARDWVANPTILSGELGDPDTLDDNVRHVVTGAADARVDGFTITGGHATGTFNDRNGGGVLNTAGPLTIANCDIRGNTSGRGVDHEVGNIGGSGGYGAGVYAAGGTSLTLLDSTIAENVGGAGGYGNAVGGVGGEGAGVTFHSGQTLLIRGVTFEKNVAGAGGGGGNVGGPGGGGVGLLVLGALGEVRVEDSTFRDNTGGAGGDSANLGGPGNGGAATITSTSSATIFERCLFADNSAGAGGPSDNLDGPAGGFAGLFFTGAVQGSGGLLVANSRFEGNSSTLGSGLALIADSKTPGGALRVVNTAIVGNTASDRGGGVYVRANGNREVSIVNTTIAGNAAMYGGGGLLFEAKESAGAAPIRLVNAILAGNEANLNPDLDTSAFNLMVPAAIEVDHSAVVSGCTASDTLICGEVLVDDPGFVDLGGGDLHLGPGSPLADAGDDASLPADAADLDDDGDVDEATPVDLDDLPRIVGAAVDLGAYELP